MARERPVWPEVWEARVEKVAGRTTAPCSPAATVERVERVESAVRVQAERVVPRFPLSTAARDPQEFQLQFSLRELVAPPAWVLSVRYRFRLRQAVRLAWRNLSIRRSEPCSGLRCAMECTRSVRGIAWNESLPT